MNKVITLFLMLFILLIPGVAGAQHIVKSGDTLWSISKQYNIFYSRLIEINPQLENINKILIGQEINITDGTKADQVVELAQALKGQTRYFLGGNDFTGTIYTDCSGWTKYIYEKFGVVLPRTSWEQSRAGAPVTFQNLRKGDLMFFGDNGRVSHVGIYMGKDTNGLGHWISNLNTRKNVVVLSFNDSWSKSRFLWAQRVL